DDDKSLERACDIMLEKGVRRLYVSLGSKGCCYADCDGVRERRSLAPLTVMVNATGGGDAFTAAVVYGNVLGLCVQKTLDYALAAGIVAISHRETINPDISATLLEKTIEERKA
ncbi:MAG: PfkB family carbohydrate kinase, partial [Oscillospiraceae bacterium]